MEMCIIEKGIKFIAKKCKLIFSGTMENIAHDTIQCLKNGVHYLNMKMPDILVEIFYLQISSSLK